jgi:hypothetical protein
MVEVLWMITPSGAREGCLHKGLWLAPSLFPLSNKKRKELCFGGQKINDFSLRML